MAGPLSFFAYAFGRHSRTHIVLSLALRFAALAWLQIFWPANGPSLSPPQCPCAVFVFPGVETSPVKECLGCLQVCVLPFFFVALGSRLDDVISFLTFVPLGSIFVPMMDFVLPPPFQIYSSCELTVIKLVAFFFFRLRRFFSSLINPLLTSSRVFRIPSDLPRSQILFAPVERDLRADLMPGRNFFTSRGASIL